MQCWADYASLTYAKVRKMHALLVVTLESMRSDNRLSPKTPAEAEGLLRVTQDVQFRFNLALMEDIMDDLSFSSKAFQRCAGIQTGKGKDTENMASIDAYRFDDSKLMKGMMKNIQHTATATSSNWLPVRTVEEAEKPTG